MEDGIIHREQARKACSILRGLALFLTFFLSTAGGSLASNHYTKKQLDALATRVGKTFWLSSSAGRVPSFFSSPAATSPSFMPAEDDSFVITDLTGQSNKNPYYAVMFESGKIGYIRPEAFHESLNLTILAADPRADEKKEAEKQTAEEKDRVEWIKSQPWSTAVKEAAISKQPPPGLDTGEVRRVLGPPMRITKLRAPTKVSEEHWFYKDGSVLIFHYGLLSKIDKIQKK